MHHSANLQICGTLLGVPWTNSNRFPEVDTCGVNVKQLMKKRCAKFLPTDVTVTPQKLHRTALRLTNVFVIVLTMASTAWSVKKGNFLFLPFVCKVGVIFSRVVFLSQAVTSHGSLHCYSSFWSQFLLRLSITRSNLK